MVARCKEKELARDNEFAANLRRYEASIAARDARTIELRALRLARDQRAQMAKAQPDPAGRRGDKVAVLRRGARSRSGVSDPA
jgi:hypothetical protein